MSTPHNYVTLTSNLLTSGLYVYEVWCR